MKTIGEIIRKQENYYISGSSNISKYVQHSISETLDRVDAYLNSKHISGDTDSLGRDKPFFNITTASVNVWYRATDIDRKDIKVKAVKTKDWINSFLATIHLQQWMRKENFGTFLNEWGRTLAKYGTAIVKLVRDGDELHISVVPFSRMIIDSVSFNASPRIEILELTEEQLRERIETHGYDKEQVQALTESLSSRELTNKQKKDTKGDFIKLYEIHGRLPLAHLTGKEEDENKYTQQMHIISFVGAREGRKTIYKDFTLFAGKEEVDPYRITHLIKEDGRTMGIGAPEHLFEAQWMTNHSIKNTKDELDLASKRIFQTSDSTFIGRNVLTSIETGDIFIHSPNEPLTQINNGAVNTVANQNFAVQWKQLGNEITSVSEAMLGATPRSGTAWRQTEAVLSESHSLFELMIQNKGLELEAMIREVIIPFIKETKLNNSDEISETLNDYDIERIDSRYIKNEAINQTNREVIDRVLEGGDFQEGEAEQMLQENEQSISERVKSTGNQRFFKPSQVNWKEQFEGMEWELEVDITGEAKNSQEALTTLNTALKLVVTPGFGENKKAQMIVGKILEMTGAISPVEWNSIQSEQPQQQEKVGGNIPDFKQQNKE